LLFAVSPSLFVTIVLVQALLFAVTPSLFVTIFLVVTALFDVVSVLLFQVVVEGLEDGIPFFIHTLPSFRDGDPVSGVDAWAIHSEVDGWFVDVKNVDSDVENVDSDSHVLYRGKLRWREEGSRWVVDVEKFFEVDRWFIENVDIHVFHRGKFRGSEEGSRLIVSRGVVECLVRVLGCKGRHGWGMRLSGSDRCGGVAWG
jgi:hypothetical protein